MWCSLILIPSYSGSINFLFAAARAAMIATLCAQEFNDLIPAGVEPGPPVAHKTGRITGIRHDAAIVYPNDRSPYVLVVLTRGFDDSEAAGAVIREISRAAWTHVNQESP